MGNCFGGVKSKLTEKDGSQNKNQKDQISKRLLPPDFGIKQSHQLLKVLGKGGTGETWLCKDLKTDELIAAKFIQRPLPKYVAPMIQHEIQIQSSLGGGHINIIAAREVILSPSHLALIIDYAPGGSLTRYVQDKWETTLERNGLFLTEDEARYFFKQFISAVQNMHAHHVAHRDLKLDNTLLDDSNPPVIKICDFGFAKEWGDIEENMLTQIGTPVYMAPELISARQNRKGYDGKKVDVWAGGVLLFVMLLGMFPFDHNEHPDPNTSDAHLEVWMQQINANWKELPRVAEVVQKVTPECQDLLDRIFQIEEKDRISIDQITQHPWFNLPFQDENLKQALDKVNEMQIQQRKSFINEQAQKMDGLDAMLQKMIDLSLKKPSDKEQNMHIDLRKFKRKELNIVDNNKQHQKNQHELAAVPES